MRKLLSTLFCFFMLILTSQAFASTNSDLFAIDEAMIEETFAPLEELEALVTSNPEADLNFIQTNYASVTNALELLDAASALGKPMEDRPVAGISGYIWGACLGIAGVAIVYFLLDDASQGFRKKETTRAVIGCVISAAVWTVLYLGLWASTAWWY